jgi:hypothetical protein
MIITSSTRRYINNFYHMLDIKQGNDFPSVRTLLVIF